jgi:hypothetical protein
MGNTSIYVFTPSKPLSGGTTYTASVPAGLQDAIGATLENTYSWKFKTLPPEILNVSPYQGQTLVPLESTVSVQFSQPMDKPSTEEAFMLQKRANVPGDHWSSVTSGRSSAPRRSVESIYVISIAPTARSASANLGKRDQLQFSTVPPGISAACENGVGMFRPAAGSPSPSRWYGCLRSKPDHHRRC